VSEAIPSYFDDPIAAQKLRTEALSWLGTPWREYYQDKIAEGRAELAAAGIDISKLDVKGPGGGIDCVGLVSEIFSRIGATPQWNFPRSPADYQSHSLGDKILDWLRGKASSSSSSIDPQSELLASVFTELEIPDAVKDPKADTPRDFFKPGDILVMRHGSLFHLPVIYDKELHFVNALPPPRGVTEGTIQDSTYSIHLVAAFRLRPDAQRPKAANRATETESSP
jgi:cell wall-associated NlpC family hydrolase